MATLNIPNRSIFCHDNLEILQGLNSECIDLIYLDPPFNKNKKFSAPIGSSAEGAEFKDIFREEDVKDEWLQTIKEDHDALYYFLLGIRQSGEKYNYCYLCYMAIRLLECHRILKKTGSIYLHCDPTMSHALKLTMDTIWGQKNFKNEIIWCYRGGGVPKTAFARKHDILFLYEKAYRRSTFNPQYTAYSEATQNLVGKRGGVSIDNKVRDLDRGATMPDWWEDINSLQTWSPERTGYPTQKPLALLKRIIETSSNEGDIVLDPFYGCATACVSAESLNRKWIGMDIAYKAYELVKERIEKTDGLLVRNEDYTFQTYPPKRTDMGYDTRPQKYVYIISRSEHSKFFKVGITSNVKNRLNTYQIGDPNRGYRLEYKIRTPHFRELERHIHQTRDNAHEWVEGPVQEIKADMAKFLKDKD